AMGIPLYYDPMQGKHRYHVEGDRIGMAIFPHKFSLSDPILLRHLLALIVVLHTCFYAILCRRQLRVCETELEPPKMMEGIMTPAEFEAAKDKEMHTVWCNLTGLISDCIFSLLDLYLGILAALWRLTVEINGYQDRVWLNIFYMSLLSIYMVFRIVPQMFYEKLSLDPTFNVDPGRSPPLVGLLCTMAFLAIILQMVVIPMSVFFVMFEPTYFPIVVWVVMIVIFLAVSSFVGWTGVPCVGRSRKLDDVQIDVDLMYVLEKFRFPLHRIFMMHTYHVGRPTAWVLGCCCCLRLDIHDNLMYNRGRAKDDLPFTQVGMGLDEEQVGAFVAHQLAHWKLWHVPKGVSIVLASFLVYVVIFPFAHKIDVLYKAADFTNFYPHMVSYWLVYRYVMQPYNTISTWVIFYFSRHFEYHADTYVCKMGLGLYLKDALLKLAADACVFPYADHAYLMWYRRVPSGFQRILNLHVLLKRHSLPGT
ncbi:hypothetical protein KR018_009034, partial [Drosophila ironensis]